MVMKTSTRRTWRPDQQLYVPGKGLLAKGSKPEAAMVNDKEVVLKDVSNVSVKNRRPDIQVYVPRAKLNFLRSSESSSSLSCGLPDLQKDNESVEEASSFNGAVKDSSSVKTLSWADQVEEYLSNDAHLKEDTDRTSLPEQVYGDEKDLELNVDQQENASSSSSCSSSYESLSYSDEVTSSNDEIYFPHCVLNQSPYSRTVFQNASNKPERSTSPLVPVCDAPNSLGQKSGAFLMMKATCEEVVDPQKASFHESVVKSESAVIKQNVTAPAKPREAAHFPEPDTEEFREMMAKRDAILDKQIAFFEKLAAKAKARSAESKQGEIPKSSIFQRLIIPTSSSNPTVNEVPDQVSSSKLNHAFRSSKSLNPHANCFYPVSQPCSMPHTGVVVNTDFYTPAPQLQSIPCTNVVHPCYASECVQFNPSPVSSYPDFWIPAPHPCNMSPISMDYSFSTSEYLKSHDSSDHFSADFYIPPPRPCNVSCSGLDRQSLDVADGFYIEPPRPVLIRQPVAKV